MSGLVLRHLQVGVNGRAAWSGVQLGDADDHAACPRCALGVGTTVDEPGQGSDRQMRCRRVGGRGRIEAAASSSDSVRRRRLDLILSSSAPSIAATARCSVRSGSVRCIARMSARLM